MIAFAFHNGMILALTGGGSLEETILRLQGNPRIPVWLIPFHFRIPSMRLKRGKRGHSLTSKRRFDKQMEKVKGFEIPENPFGVTMQGLIDGLGFKGLIILPCRLI